MSRFDASGSEAANRRERKAASASSCQWCVNSSRSGPPDGAVRVVVAMSEICQLQHVDGRIRPETLSTARSVREVYRLNRIEDHMRHTHLLAAGAAAIAISATARAQATPAPSPEPTKRAYTYFGDRFDGNPRAALGINTSSTGTLRDTLGLLVSSVMRGGPAEKAGLEEGNRIASINGVNLRSNKADLEDYENAG